ncbi:hypothetical protein BaRGS_00017214, partial [Batillaria attramentaria]
SSGCEQDWKQFSNYCYYFSNIKTTWNKSRTACKSMGADLMRFYINWQLGQPDNYANNEDCGVLRSSDRETDLLHNGQKASKTLDSIRQALDDPKSMADSVFLLEVVEKMGEILENDVDVLKEGNLAEGLLSSIERISRDVPLPEGNMTLSTHSLVLAVTTVNKESFTGLTLTTSTMADAELLDRESENDETNSLVLPRDLLTSSSNCAIDIERIAMAILPGAKLFEASKAQEADNETASKGEINSIVMSASAVGCPDITLDSPATISLVHSSNVTLSIISYVGTAVSLLTLIVTIVFFCCIQQAWADKSRESSAQFNHSVRSFSSALRRPIQSKPTKILINLCVALALSNLVFLVGMQDLLASLCWMLVEGFYMYLALVKVFMANIPNFVWKSAIVGWGVPLVIVVITVSVNNTDNYKQLHSGICWLTGPAFYASFLAPVCFILLSNFMVFILVLRVLLGLTRHKIKKEDSSNTAKHLRRAVGVAILLGLTWVFGVLAVGKATVAFNFLFAIFNSLQGLFICLFYVILRPSTRSGTRSDTYRDSSASGTEQTSTAPSSGCEQDWKQFSNYCYYFSNIKTTWNKSRTACKSMGADLMVIRGEEDQRFLDRSLY